MYQLVDFVTREPVTPSSLVFTGEKNPWEVLVDLEEIRSRVNVDYFRDAPAFSSKYLAFMPIQSYGKYVSLREGGTPLLKSRKIGRQLNIDLWFKLETRNPTGSFKDRGSAIELTVAKEFGAKGICVASTGNMAASCSCYSAWADIPCFVFVPEGTPPSKLSQAISYGGRIVQVKGSYNDAAKLAEEVARELGFYLAGDYAFRVEGQKTAAFEIAEQLYFQPPEVVIVPMGCGTNMAAYAKGFREYFSLGFIDKVPRLVGVQAEGAQGIVNGFRAHKRSVEQLPKIETIASAIAVKQPLDGVKALDAIYSTNGEAVSVNDREILEAQYKLSREEGLFVEASSATSLAALLKLLKEGRLANRRIVCVLTGDGLKDPSPMLKVAINPPTIYPEVGGFLRLYEGSYFEGSPVTFSERDEVLFNKEPDLKDVSVKAKEIAGVAYPDPFITEVCHVIRQFLMKGKPITRADFLDIIQEVLESQAVAKTFAVQDFEVVTYKDKPPRARVKIVREGKECEASASGVGPVDAVINALKEACGSEFNFALVSYNVNIRSQGTDAVVYTDISLRRNGRMSVGKGASPDVIQASIEAFERAYNGL